MSMLMLKRFVPDVLGDVNAVADPLAVAAVVPAPGAVAVIGMVHSCALSYDCNNCCFNCF